jgi:hypothetical protein
MITIKCKNTVTEQLLANDLMKHKGIEVQVVIEASGVVPSEEYEQDDLDDAIAKAQIAFWKIISQQLKAPVGKLTPMAKTKFDEACQSAVNIWLG